MQNKVDLPPQRSMGNNIPVQESGSRVMVLKNIRTRKEAEELTIHQRRGRVITGLGKAKAPPALVGNRTRVAADRRKMGWGDRRDLVLGEGSFTNPAGRD